MENLSRYKTAYSPLYEKFVKIEHVAYDEDNQPIIHAYVPGVEDIVLFRVSELTRYCL